MKHGRCGDGVGAGDAVVAETGFFALGFEFAFLVDEVLFLFVAGIVAFVVRGVLDPFAHYLFGLGSLDVLIFHTRFLLLFHHRRSLVEAVVGAKVKDEDMITRVHTFFLDLAEDGVFAAVDGFVLVVHNCTSACCRVVSQIASKPRDGGDHDDDSEFTTFFPGFDAGVYYSSPNYIVDWRLLLAGGSDEELILNVYVMLRVSDDLAIGVLNAVFRQDPATPVGAASHYLCVNRAWVLMRPRFSLQRAKRMVDVFPNRMLRSLNRYQIFILTFSAYHRKPVKACRSLIFVPLYEVPAEHKMLGDIINTVTNNAHRDVVPRHATIVCLAQLIRLPVLHGLEVHDTVVVEVLAREEFVADTRRMHICQGMLAVVPSSEAEIQASNESQSIIDHDELLMVRPVESHVSCVLEDIVIRVSHHRDISIPWSTFGTERMQGMLRMCAITADGLRDFFVHDDVDLHSSFCPPLEHLVQSPLLVIVRRSSQEQLRTQPPVGNIDGFFGLLERDRDRPEIVSPVDIPFNLIAVSFRGEGLEAMALRDFGALLIGSLFMFFVVTMIGIEKVAEFADLVLKMDRAHFGVIEVCSWRHVRSEREVRGCKRGIGYPSAGREALGTDV